MSILSVIYYEGTPGNPKSRPKHLINPDDKGCVIEVVSTVEVHCRGKIISVGPDGTVCVSDAPTEGTGY